MFSHLFGVATTKFNFWPSLEKFTIPPNKISLSTANRPSDDQSPEAFQKEAVQKNNYLGWKGLVC